MKVFELVSFLMGCKSGSEVKAFMPGTEEVEIEEVYEEHDGHVVLQVADAWVMDKEHNEQLGLVSEAFGKGEEND